MSIRQRVPFKFGDDGYAIDESGHILDEQGKRSQLLYSGTG